MSRASKLLLLFIATNALAAPPKVTIDKISVLVLAAAKLQLQGGDRFQIYDDQGRSLPSKNIAIELTPLRGMIRYHPGNLLLPSLKIVTAANQHITLDGRPFRGTLKIVPNNGYIGSRRDQLLIINEVPLPEYLVGVISNEIPTSWPLAAQKALAVAARTYAVYNIMAKYGRPFHLDATPKSQVYRGQSSESSIAHQAVNDTSGEVMIFEGKPILATYSANCGTKSAGAGEVWGRDFPYLTSKEDPYCAITKNTTWELLLSTDQISKLLSAAGINSNGYYSSRVYSRTSSGRVATWELSDRQLLKQKVPARKLRQAVGPARFRSLNFQVTPQQNGVKFTGRGYGHGVGLCQDGSFAQAKEGRDYHAILRFYYSDKVSFRHLGTGSKK